MNLSHNARYPGQDFTPGYHKYEAGLLTTRPRSSVLNWCYVICIIMNKGLAPRIKLHRLCNLFTYNKTNFNV
jgi:hypothetical protein